MSELVTTVVVDAMGGDNAPSEIIKGAVDAIGKQSSLKVILVGKEEIIKRELSEYTYCHKFKNMYIITKKLIKPNTKLPI